jgi:prepilin-type N-terminal cleavage/methylation domain-containing protein
MQKNQSGFSLVEIMLVIAVMGVLSAVAITNYNKYQSRSKISEAYIQLAAAFTAEKNFFSQFNMYTHCLRYMGYNPAAEQSRRYFGIGFVTSVAIDPAAYNLLVSSEFDQVQCPQTGDVVEGANWFSAGIGAGNVVAAGGPAAMSGHVAAQGIHGKIGNQATEATTRYSIAAIGVISNSFQTFTGNAITDACGVTIDQTKKVTLVQKGY